MHTLFYIHSNILYILYRTYPGFFVCRWRLQIAWDGWRVGLLVGGCRYTRIIILLHFIDWDRLFYIIFSTRLAVDVISCFQLAPCRTLAAVQFSYDYITIYNILRIIHVRRVSHIMSSLTHALPPVTYYIIIIKSVLHRCMRRITYITDLLQRQIIIIFTIIYGVCASSMISGFPIAVILFN